MHPAMSVFYALFLLVPAQDADKPEQPLVAEPSPAPSEAAAQPAADVPAQARLSLPSRDVAQAIKVGSAAKGKTRGLILTDVGRGIMNALSAPGDTMGTGFSVRVYTPISWIEQQASDAAKEYREFTPRDLGPDSFDPVLHVVVYPDEPTTMTAKGRATSASVQHVVIRDAEKKVAVQPLSKETFTDEVSNALGARATYAGVRATFALADLSKVRGPSGTGEFFITVVGEGRSEKNFKIKTKHFDDLPGLMGSRQP